MPRSTWRFGTAAVAGLICATLTAAAPGSAQAPPAAPTPAPDQRRLPASTRTVNLTLEQRHVIRELVRDLKVEQVPEPTKVAAGDEVPSKVTLHPIPPLIGEKVPQIKAHRFFVTQQQIVIVDPKEPKVAEVIEE